MASVLFSVDFSFVSRTTRLFQAGFGPFVRPNILGPHIDLFLKRTIQEGGVDVEMVEMEFETNCESTHDANRSELYDGCKRLVESIPGICEKPFATRCGNARIEPSVLRLIRKTSFEPIAFRPVGVV